MQLWLRRTTEKQKTLNISVLHIFRQNKHYTQDKNNRRSFKMGCFGSKSANDPAFGNIQTVKNLNEFNELINSSRNIFVVDCYAKFSSECKALTPHLERLSTAYDNVTIIRIDVDKHKDIAQKLNAKTFPYQVIYHRGREIHNVGGAIGLRLQTEIEGCIVLCDPNINV